MRTRESGIGNLPFIAVLLLFIVAVAMWFITKDEADKARADAKTANSNAAKARSALVKMSDAYAAAIKVFGLTDAALAANPDGGQIPAADDVEKTLRAALVKANQEITAKSEVSVDTTVYSPDGEAVKEAKGDKAQLRFYVSPAAGETLDVMKLLAPLPRAMELAAKAVGANNDKALTTATQSTATISQLQGAAQTTQTKYSADLAEKQKAAEGWRENLDKTRSDLERSTTKYDADKAKGAADLEVLKKELRGAKRERDAWKNRAINEKNIKALALKEDPKDGEILYVSNTLGTVWINLGRKHKLTRGTKFTVWRPGKGNIREDVAQVRVIAVEETRAEARVIKSLSARLSPTKGMNVSNPFFDPKGRMTAFIYGDLVTYPTDQAARRLAAAGIRVSRSLDQNVNVIILGVPPKTAGDEEAPEDEAAAAAAEKKAKMDRAKRLDWIMQKAIAIGAIVVTEDVLAEFVDF